MSTDDIFKFFKTGADSWATARAHRGYTATIAYVPSSGYTITIVGTGAPAPSLWPTLRNAKNAFRKFLQTKSVG